jgi:hypothetical protein
MINCRSTGNRIGEGKVFINNLLSVRTAQEAITKPTIEQEGVKIGQCIHGHPRATQAECLACIAIQHPGGNDNDFAMAHDDMRDSAGCPLLDILASNGALEIRMPSVPDDDVAPDMGYPSEGAFNYPQLVVWENRTDSLRLRERTRRDSRWSTG